MDTGSARGAERPLKGFVLCMHVEREGGLPTLSIQGYLPLCLAAEPDSRARSSIGPRTKPQLAVVFWRAGGGSRELWNRFS